MDSKIKQVAWQYYYSLKQGLGRNTRSLRIQIFYYNWVIKVMTLHCYNLQHMSSLHNVLKYEKHTWGQTLFIYMTSYTGYKFNILYS